MNRLPDPEQDPEPEAPEPEGHLRPTGPGPLVALAVIGLVLGWVLRPVSLELRSEAPVVSWLPVAALFLVAVILGAVARSTRRALHTDRSRLPAHQAVNRLVLAKACALAGALVAGGYLGYALSWVGIADGELEQQRLLLSALAGVAGVLIVVGALALERACRVGPDDEENLR